MEQEKIGGHSSPPSIIWSNKNTCGGENHYLQNRIAFITMSAILSIRIFQQGNNMTTTTSKDEDNIIELLAMPETIDIDFEPAKLNKLTNHWEPI